MHRGESVEDALQRGVFEETGLGDFQSVRFLKTGLTPIRTQDHFGLIFSVYLCDLREHCSVSLSDEHDSFEWVEMEQAQDLLQDKFEVQVDV